jgi:hypothetical protein
MYSLFPVLCHNAESILGKPGDPCPVEHERKGGREEGGGGGREEGGGGGREEGGGGKQHHLCGDF